MSALRGLTGFSLLEFEAVKPMLKVGGLRVVELPGAIGTNGVGGDGEPASR